MGHNAKAGPAPAPASKPLFVTRRAFDRLIDRWREAYLVLGHYGAAKEMGSALWAHDVELRDDAIDLRPIDPVAAYVAKRFAGRRRRARLGKTVV